MTETTTEPPPQDAATAVPEAAGTAQAASERAVRVVVLVWSAAWLVLMAFFEGVEASLAPLLSTVMLAGLAIGWVVVVVARLPIGRAYVAVIAVTALVQATVTQPLGLWAQSSLIITWTNLAALSCGFLLPGRRGRLGVVAIAGGQLAILLTRSASEGTLHIAWHGIVAAAAYALADGMAAHVAAGAVRRQSQATDAAAEQLALERGRQAVRAAEAREAMRVSRVLHDTVLNTLGALRRGVDPGEVEAMRARCAHDLRELRHLRDARFDATGDTGVGAEALVRALAARAAVLSLDVEVADRITSSAPIPTEVADAVAGACAEALINVAKHSGVRTAELTLAWDGALLDVRVQDDGCGWTGELVADHGVARSILDRTADVGIDALVATAPGAGTTVSLTWRSAAEAVAAAARDAELREPADPAVAQVLATVALRAGGWITGLLAFLTVVFWGTTNSATAVVALVILGGVLALSWRIGVRRGEVPIPAAYALLLVVAAFLVTALPARTATTCNQLAEGWWGLDGAMVVLLSLVLLTRGWWWTVAGSAAMVLGALSLYAREVPIPEACAQIPAVNAALELSIVVAIWLFREALLRQWGRASDARARSERLRIEAEVREATEQARDARVFTVLAAVVPLLDTLAGGLADPADLGVRRQCATAETALRGLLTLGTTTDWLRDLLGDAVLDAYLQGSALEVMPMFGEARLPSESAATSLRGLLRLVVDELPPGAAATAALITGPEGATLTLVSDCEFEPLPDATTAGLQDAGLEVDHVRMGMQSLLEVRW
jgi:signal transduction histidine kinase